jgi:hypothetical protein
MPKISIDTDDLRRSHKCHSQPAAPLKSKLYELCLFLCVTYSFSSYDFFCSNDFYTLTSNTKGQWSFKHQCGGVVKNSTYIRRFFHNTFIERVREKEKIYIDDLFSCECGIVGDSEVESYFLCTSLSPCFPLLISYSRLFQELSGMRLRFRWWS